MQMQEIKLEEIEPTIRKIFAAGVCRRLDAFFIWADAKIVLKRCF